MSVTRTNRFGVTLPVGVVVETNIEVAGLSSETPDPFYNLLNNFFGSGRHTVRQTTKSNVGVELTLQVPKGKAKATAELLRAMAQELEDF